MASNGASPAKKQKIKYGDTITALVGKNKVKVTIHKDVITQSSDFFRAACLGNFKEAQENVVRVPETSFETFESYVQWVYTGNVIVEADDDEANDETGTERTMSLSRLYVTADVLGDLRLRNAVIDRILAVEEACKHYPGSSGISLAYKSTPEGCTIRKLFVDYYLHLTNAQWFKDNGNALPKPFLLDVIHGRMVNGNENPIKPSVKDRCKYHEHNDEVPECVRDIWEDVASVVW